MSSGSLYLNSATIGAEKINVTGGALSMGTAALSLSQGGNVISPTTCSDSGTGTVPPNAPSVITLNGSGNLEVNTGAVSNTVGDIVIGADTHLVSVSGGVVGTAKRVTVSSGATLSLDGSSGDLTLYLGDYPVSGTASSGDLTATGAVKVNDSSHTVTVSALDPTNYPFIYSGIDIDYNGKAVTLNGITASGLSTVVSAGATVTLGGKNTFSSVTATGTVSLATTITLSASETLGVGELSVDSYSTISNGGANTITAGGNVTIDGGFTTPGNSTLVLSPASTSTVAVTPQVGNLEFASGTVSLGRDLALVGSLTVDSGATLSAVSYTLTSYGSLWKNSGTFTAGTGTVVIAKTSGTFVVEGANSWYNLSCTIPGLTIAFQNNTSYASRTRQTFLAGGTFTLTGTSANPVVITRENATGTPGNPYAMTTDAPKFWDIDVSATATLDFSDVAVYYSNAESAPITVQATVSFGYGSPYYDNYWLSGEPLFYSYTEDSDGNGKIDRIRVQSYSALNNDFSGFVASVSGYTVKSYTYNAGIPKNFFINLEEKSYNDTGATPTWNIVSNTSLRDQATHKFLASQYTYPMTPLDTSWPRVAYTLTLPTRHEIFVHMSEPVTGASFTSAIGSVSTGVGTSDYVLTVSGSIPAATLQSDILSAATLTEGGGAVDSGSVPSGFDASSLNPNYPVPTYPADYTYSSYSDSSSNVPPYKVPTDDLSHRISDAMISLPPPTSGTYDPDSYFIWPIYAKDSVKIILSDDQIAVLTAAQSAAQGIGLIRAFDGSQWLRKQTIMVQVRVSGNLGALQPTIVYDSAVASSYKGSSGLWLPQHDEADFSGLDAWPDTAAAARSGASSVSAGLWDLTIPGSDSKIKGRPNGSDFDFFFRLSGVANDLYACRLEIPSGATAPANWYQLVRPFSFELHDVTLQRGGVTVLNNVIDPTRGEKVRLSYQLKKSGAVTATVFTLDGDVVARLVNDSKQDAGDHAVSWDGKNLGGRPVARGLYFIRIVGPEMDEIRKVLVVRK